MVYPDAFICVFICLLQGRCMCVRYYLFKLFNVPGYTCKEAGQSLQKFIGKACSYVPPKRVNIIETGSGWPVSFWRCNNTRS